MSTAKPPDSFFLQNPTKTPPWKTLYEEVYPSLGEVYDTRGQNLHFLFCLGREPLRNQTL
jgi:hypothetical protein